MKASLVLTLLYSLFTATLVKAQLTTALTQINKDTLCFCRAKVALNGKVVKYNELKSLLTLYPKSATEYKRYMRGATIGTLALFTGVGAGIVALARIPKKDGFINKYSVTFFSGTAIGLTVITATRKHLLKSVHYYNREVLRGY
ncbi:MAG TPA: hypothetical protein VM888_15150 [Chitinophagaceae bacterium]|nr:hypothetical protein [Chitinophagaceae bacterium]